MELFPVSFRIQQKDAPFFKAWLRDRFGNPWIVPEGGSGALGVMGCKHLIEQADFSAHGTPWWSPPELGPRPRAPVGTQTAHLYVANSLKGFDMGPAIEHQLNLALNDSSWSRELAARCIVWNDAHLGGFGQSRIPTIVHRFMGG